MQPDGESQKKQPKHLPSWGNAATMNINNMVHTNVLCSPYFKNQLIKLKTYHEVVDEIYYKVDHLEPWEKGSRKTAGQVGMCGGVRGVGAGGIVSTAFCLLFKLYTLKLTRKQLKGLLDHPDSPYIRGLGFMYIRYCQPPTDYWRWYEEYLEDEEELDVKSGSGCMMTVGQMVRSFMLKLDWYGTLFPRIPVPMQKELQAKLSQANLCDDHKRKADEGWGEAERYAKGTPDVDECAEEAKADGPWGEAEKFARRSRDDRASQASPRRESPPRRRKEPSRGHRSRSRSRDRSRRDRSRSRRSDSRERRPKRQDDDRRDRKRSRSRERRRDRSGRDRTRSRSQDRSSRRDNNNHERRQRHSPVEGRRSDKRSRDSSNDSDADRRGGSRNDSRETRGDANTRRRDGSKQRDTRHSVSPQRDRRRSVLPQCDRRRSVSPQHDREDRSRRQERSCTPPTSGPRRDSRQDPAQNEAGDSPRVGSAHSLQVDTKNDELPHRSILQGSYSSDSNNASPHRHDSDGSVTKTTDRDTTDIAKHRGIPGGKMDSDSAEDGELVERKKKKKKEKKHKKHKHRKDKKNRDGSVEYSKNGRCD